MLRFQSQEGDTMGDERYDRDYAIGVGNRLESIQNNLGFTNKKMAENFGVSVETYRKYRRGETCLSFDRVKRFYDKTPIDLLFLFNGETDNKENFTVMLSTCSQRRKEELIAQVLEYVKQLTSLSNRQKDDDLN